MFRQLMYILEIDKNFRIWHQNWIRSSFIII